MFYFIHIHVYLFFSHRHIIIIITYFYLRSWSQVSLKRSLQNKKKKLKNCSIAIELWWSSALGYIQVSLKKKAAPWYWNEQICHLPWFQVSWPKTYFSLWCVFWSNISKKKICSFNGLPFCLLPPFLGRRSSSLLISFCYFHFGIEIW